jgi:3-hydroxy acid dehydrogenase / malonic semialdehyde reductase
MEKIKKTILVSGSSSGIGKAAALLFAKNDYRVILNGRRSNKLHLLKEQIDDLKGESFVLPFDVSNQTEINNAFCSLPDNWKRIDILVNNAGLALGLHPLHESNPEMWDQMINTNIKGLLYLYKAVVPQMVARQSGHIINISSIAGKYAYPNNNAYCATKAAVDSLSHTMRLDLAPHGIRVSNISPGAVNTEFSKVRFNNDEERAAKVYNGFQPLSPEDVAAAIWFAAQTPEHVNISELTILPTAQADGSNIFRKP